VSQKILKGVNPMIKKIISSLKKDQLPPGISLRHSLGDNESVITRITWLLNGRILAVPRHDRTISLWDPETGELLHVLEGHSDVINTAVASPDGKILASAADDYTIKLWDLQSKEPYKTLEGHNGDVNSVVWLQGGRILASSSSDQTIRFWDTETWEELWVLVGHNDSVCDMACAPDGRILASASFDGSVGLWDVDSGKFLHMLSSPSTWSEIVKVAWSPDSQIIASGGLDQIIQLWDPEKRREIGILEGHTDTITGIDFSADGRLFASKSSDDTVRIWRCDNWETVATIEEPHSDFLFKNVLFSPTNSMLVTLGEEDTIVRIWDLDYATLLGEASALESIRYTNAKVVLVGDSGVGKSGLGLVLTGQPYSPTDSTHGRRVWKFDSQTVDLQDGGKETRETFLWDLAGQPGYRLIHQLHLNEVALALVVCSSRSDTSPLAGVRHWTRALFLAQQIQGDSGPSIKKFLVAARSDTGGLGISPESITDLQRELNFDSYFETSAKEGWNIAELIQAIRETIDWEMLPKVSSTELFQHIKTFLVKEKEGGRLLSTADSLYRSFLNSGEAPSGSEDLRAQFNTCIGRIEARGMIRRLGFGDLILLQPERLDAYASAMVNAARNEPEGLGSLVEEDAQAGQFPIPTEIRLTNKEHEKLLLIATIEGLLRHEIALREQTDMGPRLVFPSEFTREHPFLPDPEGKAVVFNFEGPILNIYARLAVRLAQSGSFEKLEMWKNAANYSAIVGGKCGIFLRKPEEGQGELTLFFDSETSEQTRFQFEEYISAHLKRRALPESIRRQRIFTCPNPKCKTPVTELQIQRRQEFGFDWIQCGVCETQISLCDREARLVTQAQTSTVPEMDRTANAQRKRDTAATILQGKIATDEFDVFLAHNNQDKPQVKAIGEELRSRGLNPWLDEWNLPPGKIFIQEIERVLPNTKTVAVFVGESGIGPWERMEIDAALNLFVEKKKPLIPVLLPDVKQKPELPIFLRQFNWVKFTGGLNFPKDMNNLVWGITGKHPSAK
jgi:WD40 repeat protein